MLKGQKFKSLVSDDVFEVVGICEKTFYSIYRFKLVCPEKQTWVWVTEEGNALSDGVVFKIIDPTSPIKPPLKLEVGKTYLNNQGEKWFVYYGNEVEGYFAVACGQRHGDIFFNNGSSKFKFGSSIALVEEAPCC